jgi:hypothetical protein
MTLLGRVAERELSIPGVFPRYSEAVLSSERRSIGFQGKFYASKLQLGGLESEDPRTVFNLIAVV